MFKVKSEELYLVAELLLKKSDLLKGIKELGPTLEGAREEEGWDVMFHFLGYKRNHTFCQDHPDLHRLLIQELKGINYSISISKRWHRISSMKIILAYILRALSAVRPLAMIFEWTNNCFGFVLAPFSPSGCRPHDKSPGE